MVKKIIASVVLITLLTVAIVHAMDKKATPETKTTETQRSTKSDGLTVGAKAPDFELKTLSGEKVKLSSLKGKKVMLNFWATWCPPCKAEMPEMEQFYKQGNKDVVILAVNIDHNWMSKDLPIKMVLLSQSFLMKMTALTGCIKFFLFRPHTLLIAMGSFKTNTLVQ